MTRERHERLTEAFTGARDGALAAQLGGREVFGPTGLPEYARGDGSRPTMKTGEDLFRDFGHLAKPFTEEMH